MQSRKAAVETASARLKATKEMQGYLRVAAPFDGVITERLVHPRNDGGWEDDPRPLLKLQQVSHLRLVVPVPESYVGSIVKGKTVSFHVPALPDKSFTGRVARIPHSLDPQSRSMMVELDVINSGGTLAPPGMYPAVDWPIASSENVLLVPAASVVTTTERTFVIADQNGRAHWIDVRKGPASGDLVSIRGSIQAGQAIVKRATDEIREGQRLR